MYTNGSFIQQSMYFYNKLVDHVTHSDTYAADRRDPSIPRHRWSWADTSRSRDHIWLLLHPGNGTWRRSSHQTGFHHTLQEKWPNFRYTSLQWRHNGRDGVSNHRPHGCLLNRLFRRRSKKTSKLRVTGLCAGNSSGTGEFPAQMASNAENVSIWWRHHVYSIHEELLRTRLTYFLGTHRTALNAGTATDEDCRNWDMFNTLTQRQQGHHYADDIFKSIFFIENVSIQVFTKFVPKFRINDIPVLVQIKIWRRPGDESLSGPMMFSLLTHICVTRPRWVKMFLWLLVISNTALSNSYRVMIQRQRRPLWYSMWS